MTALSLDLGRWMWWPGKLARQPQRGGLAAQPESEPVTASARASGPAGAR